MLNSDHLIRLTESDLPAGSHDANDVLLRDVISLSMDDLNKASHVVVGCPQHMGVERNSGRIGAAGAPAAIRQVLYKLKPAMDSDDISLLDLGNVDSGTTLEEVHERLEGVVTALLRMGKKVIILGGGNDISFPDASAMHAVHPDYIAMNVDAHLDMRRSDIRHSGTPYRNLIDAGKLKPADFHEVGIQGWANSPHYLKDAHDMGVNIHYLRDIHDTGPNKFFTGLFAGIGDRPLFAGLDLDSVRASDAPGVSASCPVGFSGKTILRFAELCRTHNTPVFEITEVNPELDIDGRTARLAALTVYAFIYGNK